MTLYKNWSLQDIEKGLGCWILCCRGESLTTFQDTSSWRSNNAVFCEPSCSVETVEAWSEVFAIGSFCCWFLPIHASLRFNLPIECMGDILRVSEYKNTYIFEWESIDCQQFVKWTCDCKRLDLRKTVLILWEVSQKLQKTKTWKRMYQLKREGKQK